MLIQEPVTGELLYPSDRPFIVRYRSVGVTNETTIYAPDPITAGDKFKAQWRSLDPVYITGVAEAGSFLALIMEVA